MAELYLRPNIMPMSTGVVPAKYFHGIGFENIGAVTDALRAIPIIGLAQMPSALLQGSNRTGPMGHYSHVRRVDLRGVEGLDSKAVHLVERKMIAAARKKLAADGAGEWRYKLQGDEHAALFGRDSQYGDIEIAVTKRHLNVASIAEADPAQAPVDGAPAQKGLDEYVLTIAEIHPQGALPSDRVETSIAAFLGLGRGICGYGVNTSLKHRLGFTAEQTSDTKVIDLQRYFEVLDAVLNTDRVDIGVIGSALFMGSSYLDLGPISPKLGGSLLFGRNAILIQEGAPPIDVISGMRLHNIEPRRLKLGEIGWRERGLVPIEFKDPKQDGSVELLLIPGRGVAFSELEHHVLHELAKKCIEALGQLQ